MGIKKISILLADDHHLYREALSIALLRDKEIQITGLCGNGPDAEKMFGSLQPDILLLDITQLPARGFSTSEKILALYPDARIIALSTFFIDTYAERILTGGIKGYLVKSMSHLHILAAIRRVYTGGTYICNRFSDYLV